MFGKTDEATEKPDKMFVAKEIIDLFAGKRVLKPGYKLPEPYVFIVDTTMQGGKLQLDNLAEAVNLLASQGYRVVTHSVATAAGNGQIVCMIKTT